MTGFLRHLVSILLLPTTVVAAVPCWLHRADLPLARTIALSADGTRWARFAGTAVAVAGLALFAWCVRLFARVGRGTLAPWDPTRRLVVSGPYRHVRNPMITAVAGMLLGEALIARSPRIALWLVAFVAINHVYFVASEEPGLRRRFGASYERYRRAVPRWIPTWRAWADPGAGN